MQSGPFMIRNVILFELVIYLIIRVSKRGFMLCFPGSRAVRVEGGSSPHILPIFSVVSLCSVPSTVFMNIVPPPSASPVQFLCWVPTVCLWECFLFAPAQKSWKPKGHHDLHIRRKGFFLMQLLPGRWFEASPGWIMDHQGSPCSVEKMDSIAPDGERWLLCHPYQWSTTWLNMLVSLIGIPLHIDAFTVARRRLS